MTQHNEPTKCPHERLDEEGYCRKCGADMRSGIDLSGHRQPAAPGWRTEMLGDDAAPPEGETMSKLPVPIQPGEFQEEDGQRFVLPRKVVASPAMSAEELFDDLRHRWMLANVDKQGFVERVNSWVAALTAGRDAEIERLTGERDRQYEYNVGQIARVAELEAELTRLREQVFHLIFRPFYATTGSDGICAICKHFIPNIDMISNWTWHTSDCEARAALASTTPQPGQEGKRP